ncbi:hypothetical protein V2J09_002794 [Rumex salicifolius]
MSVLNLELLLLLAAIFSSLISLSHQAVDDQHGEIHSQTITDCSSSNPIACEIHELKLQAARLESVLEDRTKQLNARSSYAEICEKRIEEMNHEIADLQSVLSNLKNVAAEEERVDKLQIEVNHLWKVSRKNNFELHVLKSKAEEAENQLTVIASQAEQMANIVTELWIQIQQLEQALQIAEIRRAKLRSEILHKRCTLFKLIRRLYINRYMRVVSFVNQSTSSNGSTWGFYMSKALKWVMRFLSSVKNYHYQLQGIVRRELQRHDITAPLANPELVFVVGLSILEKTKSSLKSIQPGRYI